MQPKMYTPKSGGGRLFCVPAFGHSNLQRPRALTADLAGAEDLRDALLRADGLLARVPPGRGVVSFYQMVCTHLSCVFNDVH